MKLHLISAGELQLEDKAGFWDCVILRESDGCSLSLPVSLWGGEGGEHSYARIRCFDLGEREEMASSKTCRIY